MPLQSNNFFILAIVCPTTVPDIANGMVTSGDTAPYFINEIIAYQCNNNYDADGADLTNECMENAGNIVVPAVWSRMTADLTYVCRAGIVKVMFVLFLKFRCSVLKFYDTFQPYPKIYFYCSFVRIATQSSTRLSL